MPIRRQSVQVDLPPLDVCNNTKADDIWVMIVQTDSRNDLSHTLDLHVFDCHVQNLLSLSLVSHSGFLPDNCGSHINFVTALASTSCKQKYKFHKCFEYDHGLLACFRTDSPFQTCATQVSTGFPTLADHMYTSSHTSQSAAGAISAAHSFRHIGVKNMLTHFSTVCRSP